MYQLAPNIDLLFHEAGDDPVARLRAAVDAGFDAVEMWGTLSKDVDTLARVVHDHGIQVTAVVAEPHTSFAFPGTDLSVFLDGLERGVEHARQLGSPRIVATCGVGFPGADRATNLERLVEGMQRGLERTEGSDVTVVIEAINTVVDHPGALLDSTRDAVAVVRAVDSPRFRLLYDLYQSLAAGEDLVTELDRVAGLVDYVEIADNPGRGEPGTGTVDWPGFLTLLRRSGYDGPIGLEVFPTRGTVESLSHIRALAAQA